MTNEHYLFFIKSAPIIMGAGRTEIFAVFTAVEALFQPEYDSGHIKYPSFRILFRDQQL